MAWPSSAVPFFTRLAPRFPPNYFTCRQCLPSRSLFSTGARRSIGSAPFRNSFKFGSIASNLRRQNAPSVVKSVSFTSSAPLAAEAAQGAATKARFFPEKTDRVVAWWLLGSAASVFGLIVFGGLTRLTESGLSITEWRPVTGSLPPMNADDWESEFAKYRASPEFQVLNPNMTFEEFKKIYYMEWIHRIWGRFVGLSFVIPAAYFIAKKKVSAPMALRLGGITALIGFQGFIGWWMVKSGLKDDLFAPGSHPRVSQYRLTTHLGAAFVCYTAMLWNGLAILRTHRLLKDPSEGMKILEHLRKPELKFFRRSVAGLAALIFITVLSGGLVAGLDAGLIYNEFPFMGNGLAPPKSELFDPRYSRLEDRSDLWWRNMLENPATVQLDHRILAMTTFTSVMGLFAYTKMSPTMKALLPRAAARGMHGVVGFACMQVALGISTLLYLVPMHLASAHQAGSLFLLTWVLVLGNRVWRPTRTAKMVQRALQKKPVNAGSGPSPIHKATQAIKEN